MPCADGLFHVSTPVSKNLPFTKGMLGHNPGSKRDVYTIQHVLDVRLNPGSKNFDRSPTSPVLNMDQYDGSQNFSTVHSPGLMVSNLPDNALESHGIAYNNHELSEEQNY